MSELLSLACPVPVGQLSFSSVGRHTSFSKPAKHFQTKMRSNLFIKALQTNKVEAHQRNPGDRGSDYLQVEEVSYCAPGSQINLLNRVTFSLPEKSLGLVYGRSGSGKTTLLQLLAGLISPTEGSVTIGRDRVIKTQEQLLGRKVGIVFQFPERYFLADSVLEELTFGQPTRRNDPFLTQQLFFRLHEVAFAVGLTGIEWDAKPRSLSDGYKRRLALAVQLVHKPDMLLLDEPLAGLDWKARMDVIKLLSDLKKEITLIVASHDLKELNKLVDRSWQMHLGGYLTEQPWPP